MRVVRFAPSFFDDLDQLLPARRLADGTPSESDFLVFDIPPARDRLAENFEANTTVVPPGGHVRVMVATGVLVPYFALYAVLADDGAVEVLSVSISLDQPS